MTGYKKPKPSTLLVLVSSMEELLHWKWVKVVLIMCAHTNECMSGVECVCEREWCVQ